MKSLWFGGMDEGQNDYIRTLALAPSKENQAVIKGGGGFSSSKTNQNKNSPKLFSKVDGNKHLGFLSSDLCQFGLRHDYSASQVSK